MHINAVDESSSLTKAISRLNRFSHIVEQHNLITIFSYILGYISASDLNSAESIN